MFAHFRLFYSHFRITFAVFDEFWELVSSCLVFFIGIQKLFPLSFPDGNQFIVHQYKVRGGSLYNVFEEVTALPELSEIRQELRRSGALAAMMTGSGSAVFGIFPEEAVAKAAAEKMAESRWAICCRGIN